MGKFKFISTEIDDVKIIEPTVFGDARGYFMETYSEKEFAENGIAAKFVQDNESRSKKGVLRGLHFQKKNPQGKLAVDLRKKSKTFGKWVGVTLSAENKKQFYIPEGFAHGFVVLSETATFVYKCTRFYAPGDEGGLMWNEPQIGIQWPVGNGFTPLLSEKDTKNPTLDKLDWTF